MSLPRLWLLRPYFLRDRTASLHSRDPPPRPHRWKLLLLLHGSSDRSLLHHEPLIRLAATFFKQANKGNNHLVPIYNIFLIPNPLLLSRALDLLIHILVLFFPQTEFYLYIPRKQLRNCGTGQSEATTISNEVLPHVGFQDQALLAFAINSVLAPDPLPSHNL